MKSIDKQYNSYFQKECLILSILNHELSLCWNLMIFFKSACIFVNAEGCIKSVDPSLGFMA